MNHREIDAESISIYPAQGASWARCLVVREVESASRDQSVRAVVHANPYASINVVVEGSVYAGGAALPRAFLTGPLRQPIDTLVERRLLSATLVVQPWIVEAMFSVRAAELAERCVDAQLLASPRLRAWCEALGEFASGRVDPRAFWSRLAADACACTVPELAMNVLLLQGVTKAAAASGCTSRQYLRRFQRHMGMGPAAWLKLARWEKALAPVLDREPDCTPLAQVALSTGYADQAHLTRATRSIAQTTPRMMRDAGRLGRLPWPLHPAGVRSVQDAGKPSP